MLALCTGVHALCSVCSLYRWSQVVSGVVTLGCLSPRPRLCAPVGGCTCVCRRVCRRVCVHVGGVAVVWRPVASCGGGVWFGTVVLAYLFCSWCAGGGGASLFTSVCCHTSFLALFSLCLSLAYLFALRRWYRYLYRSIIVLLSLCISLFVSPLFPPL